MANPLIARALGLVLFLAATIAGVGFVSLALDADVIDAGDAGPVTGVTAMILAAVGWWVGTAPLARSRPGVGTAVLTGLLAALGYVVGAALGALLGGVGGAIAIAAAGRVLTTGFAAVVAVSAVLAATLAIVAVRSGGRGARWPWEDREE